MPGEPTCEFRLGLDLTPRHSIHAMSPDWIGQAGGPRWAASARDAFRLPCVTADCYDDAALPFGGGASMAMAKVLSCTVVGLQGRLVEVEVDLGGTGLPSLTIVGLPDAAVRESAERVRAGR